MQQVSNAVGNASNGTASKASASQTASACGSYVYPGVEPVFPPGCNVMTMYSNDGSFGDDNAIYLYNDWGSSQYIGQFPSEDGYDLVVDLPASLPPDEWGVFACPDDSCSDTYDIGMFIREGIPTVASINTHVVTTAQDIHGGVIMTLNGSGFSPDVKSANNYVGLLSTTDLESGALIGVQSGKSVSYVLPANIAPGEYCVSTWNPYSVTAGNGWSIGCADSNELTVGGVTLGSISPESSASSVPTSVAISGLGFTSTDNTVVFENASHTYTVDDIDSDVSNVSTDLDSFDIPANMAVGTYKVSVVNGNSVTNADSDALSFTVSNPPTIDSVNGVVPGSGLPGSTFTINGSGFTAADNTVTLDSVLTATSTYSQTLASNAAIGSSNGTAISGVAIPLSASSGTYNVTVSNANGITSPGGQFYVGLPSNNCVNVSGSGPKKIIFMRGNLWTGSDADFTDDVNDMIDNGYKITDPFKTDFSQFSFYRDRKNVDENGLTVVPDISGDGSQYLYFSDSANWDLRLLSNCGAFGFEYIFISGNPRGYSAYTKGFGNGVVYIDMPNEINFAKDDPLVPLSVDLGLTVVHESGHAIGALSDEYINGINSGDMDDEPDEYSDSSPVSTSSNCSTRPNTDYSHENLLYASTTIDGCFYYTNVGNNSGDNIYYRPAMSSIMQLAQTGYVPQYNTISCGYVLASIINRTSDEISYVPSKSVAESYWPVCLTMDTSDKSTVPALHPNPQPTVSSITPPDAGGTSYPTGDPTITGTNFTATGNSVQLTSTSNTSLTYEYDDLPSTNSGTKLAFTISTTTPSGTYTVRVGAFNSSWSAPLPNPITIVNDGYIPVPPAAPTVPVTTPIAVTPGSGGVIAVNHADSPSVAAAGSIHVSWPSAGTGYTYTVKAAPSGPAARTTTDTSVDISGLSANVAYTFTVTASKQSTVTVGTSNAEPMTGGTAGSGSGGVTAVNHSQNPSTGTGLIYCFLAIPRRRLLLYCDPIIERLLIADDAGHRGEHEWQSGVYQRISWHLYIHGDGDEERHNRCRDFQSGEGFRYGSCRDATSTCDHDRQSDNGLRSVDGLQSFAAVFRECSAGHHSVRHGPTGCAYCPCDPHGPRKHGPLDLIRIALDGSSRFGSDGRHHRHRFHRE